MTLMHKKPWRHGAAPVDERTPGSDFQLNAGAFWKAFSVAELAAIPSAPLFVYNADAFIACAVAGWGYYRFDHNSTAVPDAELVVIPDDIDPEDSGRWVLEAISLDLVFAYLEPRFAGIEDRITTLEEA